MRRRGRSSRDCRFLPMQHSGLMRLAQPRRHAWPTSVVVNAPRLHRRSRRMPSAQAVAVCGDRIARVGTNEDIRGDGRTRTTRVIDAGGRLGRAGLQRRARAPRSSGADELVGVNLRPATSDAGLRAAARATMRHAAEGPLDPRRLLGPRSVAGAGAARPRAHRRRDRRTTRCSCSASTDTWGSPTPLAMRLAGIRADTRSPTAARSFGTPSGEPTGIFKDNAMDLITRASRRTTLEQTMDKARAALRHAASVGVTTMQDMTASATELRAYQALRARGELTARIYSIQNHGIEGLAAAGVATGFGDDWLRIGGHEVLRGRLDGLGHGGVLRAVHRRSVDDGPAASYAGGARAGDLSTPTPPASSSSCTRSATARTPSSSTSSEGSQRERGLRDRRPRIEHAQVVLPPTRRDSRRSA